MPVFGYTNVAGDLLERTRRELGKSIVERASGRIEDSFHMAIENFDCIDNLMLVGAVEGSGAEIVVNAVADERRFTDLAAFEECLKFAARHRSRGAIGSDRPRNKPARTLAR
jgi:nucleoside 2-deoxyribosyltransferase